MKRKYIKIFVVVFIMFFSGCEDSINPKEEFYEEYILNCIIRSDSDVQTLRLLKSFNVEGFEPGNNVANPFVENAKITLSYKGKEYYFKDSTVAATNDQRFEGPINFYYLDNFDPIFGVNQENISITAVLPDGKVLSASALTPISFGFEFDDSNLNIPPKDGASYINISWVPVSHSYFQYYQTSLRVHYEEVINGNAIKNFIEVPLKKRIINDREELITPTPTRQNSTSYAMTIVDTAMYILSQKVSNIDSTYIYKQASFHALALDENIASYYFASLSENIYTVRLDQTVYSNIKGGHGVFGIISEEILQLMIEANYIKRYGFKIKGNSQ